MNRQRRMLHHGVISGWDGIGLSWLSLGVRVMEPITVLIGLSNLHIRKHKWADGLVFNQKHLPYIIIGDKKARNIEAAHMTIIMKSAN